MDCTRRNLQFFCLFFIFLAISAYASDTNSSGSASLDSSTLKPVSTHFRQLLHRDDPADRQQLTSLFGTCVYPVSGTYTRFQRILFYIILLFAFTFRFHKWILVVGIGWLGVFTATAAIHVTALSIQAGLGIDSDVIAASGICHVGCIAAVIFYLYPPKHFRKATSTILIAWTLLLGLANSLGFWSALRWHKGGIAIGLDTGCGTQEMNSTQALHLCNVACRDVEYMPVLFRTANDVMVALSCSGVSVNGDERIDINEQTDTMIRIQGPACGIGISNDTDTTADVALKMTVFKELDDPYYGSSLTVSYVSLIAPYLFLGMVITTTSLSVYYPPRFQRNWIFRRLTSTDPSSHQITTLRFIFCCICTAFRYIWKAILVIMWPLILVDWLVIITMDILIRRWHILAGPWLLKIPRVQPEDSLSYSHIRFAKFVAFIWYCWAMLGYLVYPALLFYSIYSSEDEAKHLPEQESPVSVGQWGTWAGVLLTMLAAIYARLRSGSKDEDAVKDDDISLNKIEDGGYEERLVYLYTDDFPEWLRRCPQLCSYVVTIQLELADMKFWWKNPAAISWRQEPTDLTRPSPEITEYWRPLIDNSTACYNADFEALLEKTPWSSPQRMTADVASTQSSVSLAPVAKSRWPSSNLFPQRPFPKCSRKAYAKYLSCLCNSCKDRSAALVEYDTSQSHMSSASVVDLLEALRKTQDSQTLHYNSSATEPATPDTTIGGIERTA